MLKKGKAVSSKDPGTLWSQQFRTACAGRRAVTAGHCDAHVSFYLKRSGPFHGCDPARELPPNARGGRARTVGESRIREACRGPRRLGRLNCKGGGPTRRFWGWERARRHTPEARRPAPRPALSSSPASAESEAGAAHSPWRSLEPQATALQRRRSRHREDQLHLWAAAAAAKPGNILAGQRPPLGHRLLPPRRRRNQLTP